MKILITGDAGNIGQILTKNLPNVIQIDNKFKTHTKRNMPIVFDYEYNYELDITNKNNINECFKLYKPNVIIHCAAAVGTDKCEADKKVALESNAIGIYNLLDSANNILDDYLFVNFSTTATMDPNSYGLDKLINSNTPRKPTTWYGKTKMLGEEITKLYAKKWINFLPVFLFGEYPHDTSSIWAKIFYKSLNNEKFNILLDEQIYKQYEYVLNITKFIYNIINNKDAYYKDIVIGGTDRRKFGDFLNIAKNTFESITGKKLNYDITPEADYLKNHVADATDMFKYSKISEQDYINNRITFENAIKLVLNSVLKGIKNAQ